MTDFLDQKRDEIVARLQELAPLVDEYQRLQSAAAALQNVSARSAADPTPRRATSSPARTPKAAQRGRPPHRTATTAKRPGRPKGSGSRGNETLALVQANPGITIPQLAERMGIKQNYLYRVLPNLAQNGLVTKDGRGWHPKQPA
jgi:hypothetical protein